MGSSSLQSRCLYPYHCLGLVLTEREEGKWTNWIPPSQETKSNACYPSVLKFFLLCVGKPLDLLGFNILSFKRNKLGWGWGWGRLRGTWPSSSLALKSMLSSNSDSDGAEAKLLSSSRHQFPLLRFMVKGHTPETHQSSLRWWWWWRQLSRQLSPPPEKSL